MIIEKTKLFAMVTAGVLLLSGCAAHTVRVPSDIVTTNDNPVGRDVTFKSDVDTVANHAKGAIAQLNWQLLHAAPVASKNTHQGGLMIQLMVSSSHQVDFVANDQENWNRIVKRGQTPVYFLKAKTPTSAFSYGAMIYVALHKSGDDISISVGASSNQTLEKPKLAGYIDAFASTVEKQAKK